MGYAALAVVAIGEAEGRRRADPVALGQPHPRGCRDARELLRLSRAYVPIPTGGAECRRDLAALCGAQLEAAGSGLGEHLAGELRPLRRCAARHVQAGRRNDECCHFCSQNCGFVNFNPLIKRALRVA